MMKFEKYYEELKQLDVGTVLKDEPLYKHTRSEEHTSELQSLV